MPDECLICRKIAAWKRGENPMVVHEFANSIFVVGDHQYHRGYCLVLLKEHLGEMHELKTEGQQAYLGEVMRAATAMAHVLRPWKMNYSCYGNQVPHLHWHLFPRYEEDPDRFNQPWLHSAEFDAHPTNRAEAAKLIEMLREHL